MNKTGRSRGGGEKSSLKAEVSVKWNDNSLGIFDMYFGRNELLQREGSKLHTRNSLDVRPTNGPPLSRPRTINTDRLKNGDSSRLSAPGGQNAMTGCSLSRAEGGAGLIDGQPFLRGGA